MSVLDRETVDAMGLDQDKRGIRLLIADHLDWSDEYSHLLVLQEKINAYITFYEEHQYNRVYENFCAEYAVFEIHFMHKPTVRAMEFLERVRCQVNEMKIDIDCHVSED